MTDGVCLSTKTWEGDYRRVLTGDGIDRLFGPLGRTTRRQVVLNRIDDRSRAEGMVTALIAGGVIDAWAWADAVWPGLAQRLNISPSWFGPAWPYSVPELCELEMAGTHCILHVAGDVHFDPQSGWAERAAAVLARSPGVAVVTATPPAGREWVLSRAESVADGWATTKLFSDQLFLLRPHQLLRSEVVKAVHRAAAIYPKPGGGLTFEARVASWLASSGNRTLVDLDESYLHPIWGTEGDSYHWNRRVEPPSPVPTVSARYPGPVQGVTGVVASDSDHRTVGAAAASLTWCERVAVVDAVGSAIAQDQAEAAGAEVWSGPTGGGRPVARRWAVSQVAKGWVVCLDGTEVCPPGLAGRLVEEIARGQADAVEVSRRSWVAGRRMPAERALVAFRSDAVTFGSALDLYAPAVGPDRQLARVPDGPDLALLRLGAADLASMVSQLNARSSEQALSLVVDRKPTISLPLRRFVKSCRAGKALRPSLLDAFEEWLLVEKWEEAWRGGAVAATAEFERLAWSVIAGDDNGRAVPSEPA